MINGSITRRAFMRQTALRTLAGGSLVPVFSKASLAQSRAANDPIAHRFVTANGIRIHLAEQGQGPVVLMCHGFPESWYSWRHQLPALAAAGFHAVAPDMRGYGQTDRPKEIDQYTVLHLVGDLVGVLDALKVDTAVIAGHDWGGTIAWQAALLRPDRFRAVVALSVPFRLRGAAPPTSLMPHTDSELYYQLYFQSPGIAEAELERDVRQTVRRLFTSNSTPGGMVPRRGGWLTGRTAAAALPPWLTESDIDFYATEFARAGFRGGLNYYRNLDRNWELLAAFANKRIGVPALFIAGDQDPVLTYPGMGEAVKEMVKTVPGLRKSIVLPGCGHRAQQERPQEVNAAMLEFLNSL
jgi:pimeloyl-ACP methyl ester carboxylesterase